MKPSVFMLLLLSGCGTQFPKDSPLDHVFPSPSPTTITVLSPGVYPSPSPSPVDVLKRPHLDQEE